MHERTRKRLLLIAFCTLCLLPTLAVSTWAAWHQFSWPTSLLEKKLSRELGFDVQLQEVRYPRPRQALLLGVTVSDPETKQPIARAHSIELTHTLKGPILVAAQPAFDMAYARHFWQWLQHEMLRHDGRFYEQMALQAPELTLQNADDTRMLTQVVCHWKHNAAGPQARITFKLAGQKAESPSELRIVRNRQRSPPATGIELRSSEPIPCTLFGNQLASQVGVAASFQGTAFGMQTPAGWLIAIDNAQLNDVNLEHLMQGYPHRLTGKASVAVQQAEFGGGRLVRARGSVSGGPGNVGKSLLESAREAMKLTAGSRLEVVPGATLRYQQLAFHFDIQEDGPQGGLRLLGACHDISPRTDISPGTMPSGTIMADNEGDLIRQPIHPLPVASLVAALAPSSEFHVPAAPETSMLLSVLPMPPMISSVNDGRARTAAIRQATGDKVR